MSQPTEPIAISDISTVTGVADVVIAGAKLWASHGRTPAGDYWALVNPANDQHVGVVAEHNGLYEAVIGQTVAHAATAQDAVLLLVAAMKGGAR